MLTEPTRGTLVRETVCGRMSRGGGLGVQILTFSSDGGGFEGTDIAPAVTCKRCLAKMNSDG